VLSVPADPCGVFLSEVPADACNDCIETPGGAR